jgi:Na+-driven multidrug efflux pump
VLAESYTETIAWSVFPLVFYFAFRRYLQSTNIVRPVMFHVADGEPGERHWQLVAHLRAWGFPAYGVRGAAMATVVGRVYMAVFFWRIGDEGTR